MDLLEKEIIPKHPDTRGKTEIKILKTHLIQIVKTLIQGGIMVALPLRVKQAFMEIIKDNF